MSNLSNNNLASNNFSENKLINFDVDFKGLEKSVGLFFPSVRNAMVERFRAETFYKIGLKTEEIIYRLGIEIKPIPPKAALPMFDKISLEHEEEMYDMWAKLLTASTNKYNPIQIQYADILSQISVKEAKLLKEIYIKQLTKGKIEAAKICKFEIDKQTQGKHMKQAIKGSKGFPIILKNYVNFLDIFKISFPHFIYGEKETLERNIDYASSDTFVLSKSILDSLLLLVRLNLIVYEYTYDDCCLNVARPVWGVALTEIGYKFIETLEKYNIEDEKCSN